MSGPPIYDDDVVAVAVVVVVVNVVVVVVAAVVVVLHSLVRAGLCVRACVRSLSRTRTHWVRKYVCVSQELLKDE